MILTLEALEERIKDLETDVSYLLDKVNDAN